MNLKSTVIGVLISLGFGLTTQAQEETSGRRRSKI